MILNILAGGPAQNIPDLHEFTSSQTIWAGVDRGVYELIKRDIIPQKAFGDFDSTDEKTFSWIKKKMTDIQEYPSEKDETDLELALLWGINLKPEKVRIFGATGGRLDHFLGNIQLMLKGLKSNVEIEMIDKQNYVIAKCPGIYQVEQTSEYPYISFIPVSNIVKNLTLKGFKYPLTNYDISLGSVRCISNELLDKIGTFSFTDGILIMVKSHD